MIVETELFPEILSSKKKTLPKDVYYVAISQLQKAIRMGLAEDAIRSARLLWLDNPWRLFSRLHVILGEDCARDHDLIDFVISFYESGHSFKDWESVALLVMMMASSRLKSHEVNYSMFSVLESGGFDETYFCDGSPLNQLSKADVMLLSRYFEGVRWEDYQRIMSPFASDKVLDGIWKIITKIDSGEKQLRFYPLWRKRDQDIGRDLYVTDEVVPELLRRKRNVLLNAIDKHTSVGKMAFNVIAKKFPSGLDKSSLGTYEWVAVASKMNSTIMDRPLENQWRMLHSEALDWFGAHLEKIMDVREYLLEKKAPHVVDAFDNVCF